MIQPNNQKPSGLFSTSNTRAGGGFAAGLSGTEPGVAGSSSGFRSMLSSVSGDAGRKQRSEAAGLAEPKALLTRPSRADPLSKALSRDGPLATEIKRAREGKSSKGGTDGSPSSDSLSSRATRAAGKDKAGVQKASGSAADSDEVGPSNRESLNATGVADRSASSGGTTALGKAIASDSDLNSTVNAGGASGLPVDRGHNGCDCGQLAGAVQAVAQADTLSPDQDRSGGQKKTSGEPETGSGEFPQLRSGAAGADDQSGASASQAPAGKVLPPTTVARFNKQLLTLDPRQMLLGLDSLGSRMMISAAQSNQGENVGGQEPSPTAAARSQRSAAGEVSQQTNQPLTGHDGAGAASPTTAAGQAYEAETINQVFSGSAIDDNCAHNAPDQAADTLIGSENGGIAVPPELRSATVDGGNTGLSSAKADTTAAAALRLATSAVAGNQETEQAASARAGGPRDLESQQFGSEDSQVASASASAAAGSGGHAGQFSGQSGAQSGGDSAGRATGQGGHSGAGEQQQASRVLAQQVERAVASASRQAERLGGASGPITLRLKPESLGQVRIKLSAGASGQGLGVKIEVGSTDAQRLLSESMGSLRDALKAKGLVLEQGAVQVDPSLAAGTLRETTRPRESASQTEPPRADATTDATSWQRPAGDDLGKSQGDGGANGDGRRREDARSNRGGFFDGAAILPGGSRGAGISAR